MLSVLSRGRGPLVVCVALAALAVGGCGRRGPLEAPTAAAPAEQAAKSAPAPRAARTGRTTTIREPAPAAANLASEPLVGVEDTPEDETATDENGGFVASPTPVPHRRTRGYTIPKDPFILDPIL